MFGTDVVAGWADPSGIGGGGGSAGFTALPPLPYGMPPSVGCLDEDAFRDGRGAPFYRSRSCSLSCAVGASVGSARGSVVGSPQADTDLTGVAGSLASASGCQTLSTSASKVRAPSSLSFGFGNRVTGDSTEIVELTANNINNRNRKLPNPAIIKHRKLGVFQTVNNSKLI